MKTSGKSAAADQSKQPKLVVKGKGGRGKATVPGGELAPVQFHIRKIMVPLDFSETSQKALRYARALASFSESRVVLVHVIEPIEMPAEFGYIPFNPDELTARRREQSLRKLQDMGQEAGLAPYVDSPVVRIGKPWRELVDAASALRCDLVVIGTHGLTGIKHVLLGSVAEQVIRHATCPVLVVRSEERDFVS
jgi:universal stress protein A